jgi:tetratricopeptide (TPR) repeat protein
MCLAMARRSLTDLDRALVDGRAAVDIARADGLHEIECETLIELAQIYLALGRTDTAATVMEQVEEFTGRHADDRYLARMHEGHAHVARRRGEAAAARDHWKQALDLFPAQLAEAENARLHLDSTDFMNTTCARCATRPPEQTRR